MSGEHEEEKKNLMNSAGWSLSYRYLQSPWLRSHKSRGARNKGQWVKRYFLMVKGSNSTFS